MTAAHRIRRQHWQVRAPSLAAAFAVRQALRDAQESSLLPALESAFDAVVGDGVDRHIQRLEITIRVSSPEQLVEELPTRLGDAARLTLGDLVEAAPAPGSNDLAMNERLHHYLRHGQVDWFDTDRVSDDLRTALADEAARWSRAPESVWDDLRGVSVGGEAVTAAPLFRFLQLLDAAGRTAWWAFARQRAAKQPDDPAAGDVVEALHILQDGCQPDQALHLQALALLRLALAGAQADADWATAVAQCAACVPALATVDRKIGQKIATPFSAVPDATVCAESVALQADEGGRTSQTISRISPNFSIDRDKQPGMSLRLAGLILLHPYLPRLFAALRWLAERHPTGTPFPYAHLPRALALLYWLATGRDEPYEYELGTAKLLLGIAPEASFPVGSGWLGDAELDEARTLLLAVISHWSALGKTSADGLRCSFLQRAGLLSPGPDGWQLRLQPASFDILLDRLPWGLSLIHLPWLPNTLHVEWSRI